MKLTHVSMDVSFIGSHLSTYDVRVKQLAGFFAQCTTLRALELRTDLDSFANSPITVNYEQLSHFLSLEYCRLNNSQQSTCAQDILNNM